MRAAALILPMAIASLPAFAVEQIETHVDEPRAYGYSIGDVVSRHITIDAPGRLVLDTASLPEVGRRGRALELRKVSLEKSGIAGGDRYRIDVQYQIFQAPREVRTLEMPTFNLRFTGAPRAQDVRIEAWPVTVSPLVPIEVSPRNGLGELRPDIAPPLLDMRGGLWRLAAYAAAMLVMLAYLAYVYLGLPWWSRRQRPFTQAWVALRALPAPAGPGSARPSFELMHRAVNQAAGQVLFEPGLESFLRAQPRYAPLRDDFLRFFRRSREVFFGDAPAGADEQGWILGFCKRCRDLERGAA